MAAEPDWLTAGDLVRINQRIVAESGEPFNLLKPHELESAPMRPRHLWHYEGERNVAALAVRLMLAVAWGHPFEQGNKRTGFIAAFIFLNANGWHLDIPDYEEVAELIEAAVANRQLEPKLVELFESHLKLETLTERLGYPIGASGGGPARSACRSATAPVWPSPPNWPHRSSPSTGTGSSSI